MRYSPGDLVVLYDIDTMLYQYGIILTDPEIKVPLVQYTVLMQKYPVKVVTLPETQIHPYYMRNLLNADLEDSRRSGR